MAINYEEHKDMELLRPPALLARLLVPLCTLANPAQGTHANAHVHIINALRSLGVLFPPKVAANFETQLPLLLEAHAPATRALEVGEALMAQRPLHVDEEAWSEGTNTLLGPVFACVSDERFVRMGLQVRMRWACVCFKAYVYVCACT